MWSKQLLRREIHLSCLRTLPCHDLDKPPQVYSHRVEKEKHKEGVPLAANAGYDAANIYVIPLYKTTPYIHPKDV